MRFLWKVPSGLSDERGHDGEFPTAGKWDGVYPVHGMSGQLPKGCAETVNPQSVFSGQPFIFLKEPADLQTQAFRQGAFSFSERRTFPLKER